MPVFGVGKVASYYECSNCKSSYQESSIRDQTGLIDARTEAEFVKTCRFIIVSSILADGKVLTSETKSAKEIFHRATGKELSDSDIIQEKLAISNSKETIIESLKASKAILNDAGKEAVILCAFFVAISDGDFHYKELLLLKECAKALGMTDKHLEGILSLHSLSESQTGLTA